MSILINPRHVLLRNRFISPARNLSFLTHLNLSLLHR